MITPDADREVLRERLISLAMGMGGQRDPDDYADAIADDDDLLVVDLRCPTCGGSGTRGRVDPSNVMSASFSDCPSCHGTGRRDVRVVDADNQRWLCERGHHIVNAGDLTACPARPQTATPDGPVNVGPECGAPVSRYVEPDCLEYGEVAVDADLLRRVAADARFGRASVYTEAEWTLIEGWAK